MSPPAPLWGQDQRSVLCPGNPQGEVVLWSGTAEEPGWTLVRLLPPDPAPGTVCHRGVTSSGTLRKEELQVWGGGAGSH